MQKESYLAGKRILAVDDEPDILESIEDILEGSIVDCAGDYSSASEKLKMNRYDLVILDIMGVNGLKLLEEAVERNFPSSDAHRPCHKSRNFDDGYPKRRDFLSSQGNTARTR